MSSGSPADMHAADEQRRTDADQKTAFATAGETTLAELKPGQRARILSVDADDPSLFRLVELGLVPGHELDVVKEAPLGDPIEIRIMDYMLCLRRREARFIRVAPLG